MNEYKTIKRLFIFLCLFCFIACTKQNTINTENIENKEKNTNVTDNENRNNLKEIQKLNNNISLFYNPEDCSLKLKIDDTILTLIEEFNYDRDLPAFAQSPEIFLNQDNTKVIFNMAYKTNGVGTTSIVKIFNIDDKTKVFDTAKDCTIEFKGYINDNNTVDISLPDKIVVKDINLNKYPEDLIDSKNINLVPSLPITSEFDIEEEVLKVQFRLYVNTPKFYFCGLFVSYDMTSTPVSVKEYTIY